MYKLLILSSLLLFNSISRASTIEESLLQTETAWAKIYYSTQKNQQSEQYLALLKRVEKLVINFPRRAEPLIWQAIIIATNAERQTSFEALDAIHKARNILQKAITINPLAMEGSAFVTLGSLYNMVPGWPIAWRRRTFRMRCWALGTKQPRTFRFARAWAYTTGSLQPCFRKRPTTRSFLRRSRDTSKTTLPARTSWVSSSNRSRSKRWRMGRKE